jgi:hypothetical protein
MFVSKFLYFVFAVQHQVEWYIILCSQDIRTRWWLQNLIWRHVYKSIFSPIYLQNDKWGINSWSDTDKGKDTLLLSLLPPPFSTNRHTTEYPEWRGSTFWRKFQHDGKINPAWCGWWVHALPRSIYVYIFHHKQSCGVQYAPADSADTLPLFLLYSDMYSVRHTLAFSSQNND